MGYFFNLAKIQSFRGYTKYITRKVINNFNSFRHTRSLANTQIRDTKSTQTKAKSTPYNSTTHITK